MLAEPTQSRYGYTSSLLWVDICSASKRALRPAREARAGALLRTVVIFHVVRPASVTFMRTHVASKSRNPCARFGCFRVSAVAGVAICVVIVFPLLLWFVLLSPLLLLLVSEGVLLLLCCYSVSSKSNIFPPHKCMLAGPPCAPEQCRPRWTGLLLR